MLIIQAYCYIIIFFDTNGMCCWCLLKNQQDMTLTLIFWPPFPHTKTKEEEYLSFPKHIHVVVICHLKIKGVIFPEFKEIPSYLHYIMIEGIHWYMYYIKTINISAGFKIWDCLCKLYQSWILVNISSFTKH